MLTSLSAVRSVLVREFRLISHDINIILVVLVSPLLYALLYGSIYMHKTEQEVPIVVVDNDHTELSRLLIRDLDSHQSIRIASVMNDLSQARAELTQLRSEGVVYIPDGFERSLKSGQGCDLHTSLNTSRFLVSNDLNRAINEVVATIGAGVKIKFFMTKGYSEKQAFQAAEPLQGEFRPLFNPVGSYGDFFLPGLLMLILQQTLLIGLSESITKERAEGLLSDLKQQASGSALVAVLGKGSCYLIFFGAYALFFVAVIFPIFHLPLLGDVLALSTLLLLFLFTVISVALFASSFFRSKAQALQFMALSSIPLFLLSGYSWPLESMPPLLQWLSQLIPTTPFLRAFVRVTQMGASWSQVTAEILQLLLLSVAWLLVSVWRIRFVFKRIDSQETPSI